MAEPTLPRKAGEIRVAFENGEYVLEAVVDGDELERIVVSGQDGRSRFIQILNVIYGHCPAAGKP